MWQEFVKPILSTSNHNELPVVIFDGKNDHEVLQCKIALIGVKDNRGSSNENTNGIDIIRKQFYNFRSLPDNIKIADIGNIEAGETQKDTLVAIEYTLQSLIKSNILPIVLGGSIVQAYAQATAYFHLENKIDLVLLDEQFELETFFEGQELTEKNYLYKLFIEHTLLINSFTLLGYQSYYVRDTYLKMLRDMKHDYYRLGMLREDIKEVEPMVRNSDTLALNINAIRSCDAPGCTNASPNGFFADEMCQVLRYASASDKFTSIGIYNYNAELDIQEVTAKGIAQMIYYIIDGYTLRVGDYPIVDENDFLKFILHIEDANEELVFMKSKKSNRWWIRIPIMVKGKKKFQMYPCSYKDYLEAMENEIPDIWLKALDRIS
jgi:formiminoglutamase